MSSLIPFLRHQTISFRCFYKRLFKKKHCAIKTKGGHKMMEMNAKITMASSTQLKKCVHYIH